MSVDLLTVLNDTYAQLGAAGSSDLEFWTTGALTRFGQDAAEQLCRRVPLLVKRAALNVASGTAEYAHPAHHIQTVHLSVDQYSLRPTTVQELEALDDAWRTSQDYPERYVEGLGGDETVILYPNPIVAAAGAIVYQANVDESSTTLEMPPVLSEYFRLAMIAGARRSEGKGAMPDVAQWCEGVMSLIEQAAAQYWGNS